MAQKLYFGHLTLYDERGEMLYKAKNTRLALAIEELNQILRARGDGATEILIRRGDR
jgi:hypothetical protein